MTTLLTERVLGLRTCSPGGYSNDGQFRWPLDVGATVEAPDWDDAPQCGGGLHFLPWGEGNGGLLNWSHDAHWLVIETDCWVRIDDSKAKCRSAIVRFVGNHKEATDYLYANGAAGRAVVGGTAIAGEKGIAIAGDYGTAIAGDYGTATAGDSGTAIAGYGGTATAGYGGTATARDGGTATAGYRGTATAGDYGTATAGYGGTATAGYGGTATAGDYGTIVIRWWDGNHFRLAVGYVGEGGVKANTPYRCDENGTLVEVSP